MAGSDVMYELAKGNPGALSVVSQLDYDILATLRNNTILRGSLIWIAYKDICKEDLATFIQAIKDGSIEGEVKKTRDYKYMKEEGLL